jgi:hypothetical protein
MPQLPIISSRLRLRTGLTGGSTALCPKCGIDSVYGRQVRLPDHTRVSRNDELALLLSPGLAIKEHSRTPAHSSVLFLDVPG